MSKAVKWQIPFVSTIEKTKYRIDIYAEGYSGNPIQLLGGPQPFVTEENKSDDFFTPVRSQTGNIQVCTAIPAGGTLSLDDILPANNIDHPVRLVSISGNTETIEWQGFLSCEAYSQSYTSIPQILTLPIISVLEAVGSMFINKSTLKPLGTIESMLGKVLNTMLQNSAQIVEVYFPKRGFDILNKKINASVFLSREEYKNAERVMYQMKGINIKDIFQIICTFMGWTVREEGQNLYFQEPGGNGVMYMTYAGYLITYSDSAVPSEYYTEVIGDDIDMDTDLEWRSADHKRNFRQGAHSVKVESKLEKFDIGANIPELPFGDLYQEKTTYMSAWWVYLLASGDDKAYSNLSFLYKKADINIDTNGNITIGAYSDSDVEDVIEQSLPYAGQQSPAYLAYSYPANTYTTHAGAFMARMQFDLGTPDNQHQNTQDGLYVSLFGPVWQQHTAYTPIFQMKGVQVFAAYESGYINLMAQVKKIFNSLGVGIDNTQLQVSLKVGEYNWTGSAWSNTNMTPFFIEFDNDGKIVGNWNDQMGIDEVDGLLMPIDETITGEIVLSIYAETKRGATGNPRQMTFGMFFSDLDVSFIPRKDVNRTERDNNTYYQELETNFREDMSISPSIASWLHNAPSPSLLFNANNTPLQLLSYTGGNQRPEVDLLNRLAAYYGAARQTLELKVKHPTAAALPLLKLNGISPDTKKYLPLAESRDWIADVATLTCFETPE